MAKKDRAFFKVAVKRRKQVIEGEGREGVGSWMWSTRKLMWKRGLGREWDIPEVCCQVSKEEWKERVYEKVEEYYEGRRMGKMRGMKSMGRYARTKSWERVDEEHAEYTGEVGRWGAMVCERYLDDMKERGATSLKLQCRADCLPVMKRVMKMMKMPLEWGTCLMCNEGCMETIDHLIMDCNAYATHRERLVTKVTEAYSVAKRGEGGYEELNREEQIEVMMGKGIGCKVLEGNIDHAFKRFLKRAWRKRKLVTKTVEAMKKSSKCEGLCVV